MGSVPVCIVSGRPLDVGEECYAFLVMRAEPGVGGEWHQYGVDTRSVAMLAYGMTDVGVRHEQWQARSLPVRGRVEEYGWFTVDASEGGKAGQLEEDIFQSWLDVLALDGVVYRRGSCERVEGLLKSEVGYSAVVDALLTGCLYVHEGHGLGWRDADVAEWHALVSGGFERRYREEKEAPCVAGVHGPPAEGNPGDTAGPASGGSRGSQGSVDVEGIARYLERVVRFFWHRSVGIQHRIAVAFVSKEVWDKVSDPDIIAGCLADLPEYTRQGSGIDALEEELRGYWLEEGSIRGCIPHDGECWKPMRDRLEVALATGLLDGHPLTEKGESLERWVSVRASELLGLTRVLGRDFADGSVSDAYGASAHLIALVSRNGWNREVAKRFVVFRMLTRIMRIGGRVLGPSHLTSRDYIETARWLADIGRNG